MPQQTRRPPARTFHELRRELALEGEELFRVRLEAGAALLQRLGGRGGRHVQAPAANLAGGGGSGRTLGRVV